MQSLTWAELHTVMDECLVGCRLLSAQDLAASVAFVAEERMPYVPHVCPDLMRTTCFQMALYQCDRPEALQHFIMSDGRFAHLTIHWIDIHLQSVFCVSAYIARYSSLVVAKGAPDKCIVLASAGMVKELLCQMCLGIGSLGNDQQPACVLVDAVHQAYGRVVRVEVLIVAQMPRQSVDQCAAIVAATGMHHQARWLVDDEQDLIFIDNIEGQVLGNDFPIALGMIQDECDDVARLDLVVALDGLVVGPDATRLCCFLYAVAAGAGYVIHQELIDADGALPLIHFYAPMLMLFLRDFLQQLIIVEQYVFHALNS